MHLFKVFEIAKITFSQLCQIIVEVVFETLDEKPSQGNRHKLFLNSGIHNTNLIQKEEGETKVRLDERVLEKSGF